MVTGQYYLNRINSQLMTIEGQVRQIRQELRNETYGEITSAAEACMELEEGLALSLDLTTDERMRLVNAEGDIDKAYKQKLKDVQDFLDDVDKLFSAHKLDVDQAERLLKEETAPACTTCSSSPMAPPCATSQPAARRGRPRRRRRTR